ncbi:MAG: 23S rRNA (guanosine(2251)-2'-O)-methyltransferase RlmB [Defluviitaleaceae bacterium]|nr:23S rRNA (guanosine(2251)-2'-O)-methyltransferase RlmB [Defluviitaleaceae bacterium]MCL2837051.1 23S rRNA (guanosine(2251)-2'-O)-methyltransferase RlmB [Defluviitaleaceae bacterium]
MINKEDYINEGLLLEGRNAVMEAVKHGRAIDRVLIKNGETEGSIRAVAAKAREAGYVVSQVPKQELDQLSVTGRHQGIIAICAAHEYAEIPDMLNAAKQRNEAPFIVMLDGVTDPHNLGAVIRTAEAAGAHGCVIPKRRSVGVTPAVVRASAGAVEYLPVARVTNLTAAVKELKEAGLWVCGASIDGKSLYEAQFSGPLAVVVGGEGSGLSRLVEENCDFTVSVPMKGRIESLNASVAAALILYEAARQRFKAL